MPVLGLSRRTVLVGLVASLCTIGIVSLILSYLIPAPPSKVTIGTAFKGASFDWFGQRYREHFASANVTLELGATEGALENLILLQNPDSGVQVGFVGLLLLAGCAVLGAAVVVALRIDARREQSSGEAALAH